MGWLKFFLTLIVCGAVFELVRRERLQNIHQGYAMGTHPQSHYQHQGEDPCSLCSPERCPSGR